MEVFNSIDENIKFTLEIPSNGCLNFLDLSIRIENNKIVHKNYKKELSSGLSLARRSWLPSFVKTNFIQQSYDRVQSRCSVSLPIEEKNNCIDMCTENLIRNGYSTADIRKALNKNKSNKNRNTFAKSILKLPFVNDSLVRKVNSLIKKYKLNVNLVSVGNKKLRHSLKPKRPIQKHKNCNICNHLPEQHNCEKAGVIYQFTCKFCYSMYIGKTCRPFHVRYKEHSNSIKNNNSLSALSEHVAVCKCKSIDDFSFNFLSWASDPVEVSLLESRFIESLKPSLNRRHEGAGVTRLEVR